MYGVVRCKDCLAEGVRTVRKAPYPGPRCATHHRERRRELKQRRHRGHLERTFGITAEEYQKILDVQGGVCAICQRAKGTGRKKLAVDHDHITGEVRGLLCASCNRGVLGHLRDDPDAFRRAMAYLASPPARRVLGIRKVPGDR